MNNRKILIPALAVILMLTASFPAFADGGWIQDSFGWWYRNEDGGYPASGWGRIDGTWYYFRDSGYISTGPLTVEGVQYYLDDSGAMVKDTWLELRGNWYYFLSDGSMARSCWVDAVHYVDEKGVMVTDRWIDDVYVDEDGVGEHPDSCFF